MSEMRLLKEAFQEIKEGTDLPVYALFEHIPDLGEVEQFIETIRNEDEELQAIFLKSLSEVRTGCWKRLEELSHSSNCRARNMANLALLKSTRRDAALVDLIEAAKLSISDHNAEDRYPLAWFIPDLQDDADIHGPKAFEELYSFALSVKNQEAADLIKNCLAEK